MRTIENNRAGIRVNFSEPKLNEGTFGELFAI